MAAPNSAGETVSFDAFVDRRIAKTRAAVKTADLAVGAVTLLAGLLALLLVAAVADHWVVRGGLDRNERYALLGVGLVGALLYFATRLAPIALRRVNPLYAAREIERESPALKNSLLNLLQLRGGSESVAVRQTLERQAAERLAQTGDSPIDHSSVVRAAKVLLALVAIVGAYIVATPKDFFASAGRVLAPWADIAAPSRVQVRALTPGDARVNQGESLAVSTEVTGLAEGEVVELVYTTKDGRFVDRRVAMRGGTTAMSPWTATLPAESGAAAALGLQSDFTYRVEAGDARTLDYRVEVLTAPMIAPVRVRYEYPAYTGLAPREVEGVGDLRALEGTRVALTAEANLPIESAEIDLGADGRPDVRMRPEGKQAQGVLTMRLGEQGRSTPTEYVIRFASEDGLSNPSPPRHRIEVVADLAPEAAIVAPEEAVVDVPLDSSVRVEVEARDPDFALSRVRLIGEAGGRVVLERDLLTGDGRGKFTAPTELAPAEIGLRPGDVLEYRVEAYDNRAPQPRVGTSDRRQLRVIGPAERGEGGGQQPGDGAPQPGKPQPGQPQGGQPKGEQGEGNQGAGGQQQEGQQQPNGQQPPKAGEPSPDGASQEGGESAPGKEQSKENKPNEGEGQEPQGGGLAGPGKEGEAGESNEANPGKGTAGDSEKPPEGESGSSGAGGSREGASDGNQGQPSSDGQQGGGAKPQASEPSQPEGGGGAGEDAQPVARDGSDDRSAFDRMREWLKQQSKSQGGSQETQQGEQEQGNPSGDEESGEAQGETSSDANPGEGQAAKGQQDKGQQGQKPNQPTGDAQGQEGAPSSDESQQAKGQRGEEAERSEKGRGAGDEDREGNASNSTSGESGEETPPGEPSDPQAGPRQGTGSSGQNQAADQGAGQSADRGAGETTGKPGDQQQGDKPTGEQGQGEPTDGDGSRETEGQGDKAGGKPPTGQQGPEGQGAEGQDRPGEGAQPTPNGAEPKPPGEVGDRRGEGAGDGGKPGELGGPMELADRGATDGGAGEGAESGGDAANLDYARKQTDLVLKRLDEQLRKKEVDRRLLDKLGWTEEDLRRFVDRWQSRQQKAAERGAEGQSELDRALRSLGLRPEGPQATERLSDDQLRDLREGARTQTPPRLRDALDWYQRSVSRAADDADSEE